LALVEIFALEDTTESSDMGVIPEKVSEHTGWSLSDLEFLVGEHGFDITSSFPNGFQDERIFLRLWDAFAILRQLKMSAQQCRELSEIDLNPEKASEIARNVKQAVREKYDEMQWLELARPLRDKLRDKQRSSLAEYASANLKVPLSIFESPHPVLEEGATRPAVWELQQKLNAAGVDPRLKVDGIFGPDTRDAVTTFQQIHGLETDGIVGQETWTALDNVRHSFRNANDLYTHFLIDVEMNPCMLTSRIKQALSSTQLFVQRCLMNLEPDVAATVEDVKWQEWIWMKNYRVWEANRKIFLYPENWIEPELRDDKSPFFKELESELMQSALTNDSVEEAYIHYLEKLDQVAHLQIVGMYHQLEKNEYNETVVDILHVFGRTSTSPHAYFYIERKDSAYWTSWEKMDLDIEGEHLIPVVWNRRLYLFWPTFLEKAEPLKPKIEEGGELSGEPEKYWELRLAWSQFKQGRWENKMVSSEFFKDPPTISSTKAEEPVQSDYVFRSYIDEQNMLYIVIRNRHDINDAFFEEGRAWAFRFGGCNSDDEIFYGTLPVRHLFKNLTGMRFSNMNLSGFDVLYLPAPSETKALNQNLSSFWLLVPHDGSEIARHPLFYRDRNKTFFVIQKEISNLRLSKSSIADIDPGMISSIAVNYYHEQKPMTIFTGISDDISNSGNATDPVRFSPSFPVIPEMMLNPSHRLRASSRMSVNDVSITSTARVARRLPNDSNLNDEVNGDLDMSSAGFLSNSSPNHNFVSMRPNRSVSNILASNSRSLPASVSIVQPNIRRRFQFQTFYHYYVCIFVRELYRHGIEGLLQRKIQTHPHLFLPYHFSGSSNNNNGGFNFKKQYEPHKVANPIVIEPYPLENVDFDFGGAYSQYNWELFFHAPLMIADRLSKNQRFEESQKWFHYIFDPTDKSGLSIPQRYWITKPFYETSREDYKKQRIQNILKVLAVGGDPVRRSELSNEELKELEEFENTVMQWRKWPFKPHLIARMRNTAYQKTVVMKYIDNLIAWGDMLFGRDTIESINEAAQLYILASDILGHRPEEIPGRAEPIVQTYNSLEPKLGKFSVALVQAEELITPPSSSSPIPRFVGATDVSADRGTGEDDDEEEEDNEETPTGNPIVFGTDMTVINQDDEEPPATLSTIMYFCAPRNDKLLAYWDTVSDRLFKIRHCMNIKGIVRQLPLFEPPIDPAILVQAAAAGIDISSVLNDISGALPHYRFNVLVQKAAELCAEVKSFGTALLSALEKQDAEYLAQIRAEHESSLLSLIELVKTQQRDEAYESQEALRKSRDIAATRYSHHTTRMDGGIYPVPGEGQNVPNVEAPYYTDVIPQEGEEGVLMVPREKSELKNLREARDKEKYASGFDTAASIAHIVPNFDVKPFNVGFSFGGSNVGAALSASANIARALASNYTFEAGLKSKLVQAILRADDHTIQANVAAAEIMHIDKQIVAAQIRWEIAGKELANHKIQIENAQEIENIMRTKYTNQELYSWMVGQISGLYFQMYQLAYELAKRAESAYRFELGIKDSTTFIQFGYWDNLKRGLLAGERLYHDIKRMELAYLDKNKREYEITKHCSLAVIDPMALAQLKRTGECFISLPEALFDIDYPGHYMRRIKSVGLTIPCVTGPYAGVNCTLTLVKSSTRHSDTLQNGKYRRNQEGEDIRFTDSSGAIESIVTSSGQNDSGMFETNLKDERYLPFEGAGTISQWKLELSNDLKQFDFDTIADVVLRILYTAREAGGSLKAQAKVELRETLNEFLRTENQKGLAISASLRHEFSSEWHSFLNPRTEPPEGDQTLIIALDKERFPFLVQDRTINISAIELFVKIRPEFSSTYNESTLKLSLEAGTEASANPLTLVSWNGLLRAAKTPGGDPGKWTLTAWHEPTGGTHERIDKNVIEDIVTIYHYSI
jgi:hypothetical protein